MASREAILASSSHITPTAIPKPITPSSIIRLPPIVFGPIPAQPVIDQYAPAWFYSALYWLGKRYWDANNERRQFMYMLIGSDVDPFANLGDTRLFAIRLNSDRQAFNLILNAEAVNISTDSDTTATYPTTDLGIVQLYKALSESPVFKSVKFCYIPGYIGSLSAGLEDGTFFRTGYDPSTGLRSIVLGTAVSQIVPLDDFLATHNEQIYNTKPKIVPVADALVYDVTQHNTFGATAFNLPIFYSRNQVSYGNYYVNKIQAGPRADGVARGQTPIFEGGPGYVDTGSTSMKLTGTATSVIGDYVFTMYTYSTATVVTTSKLGAKVKLGAVSLNCTATPISSGFTYQGFIGFYRDAKWTNCLGIPIYDFGRNNSSFTATFQDQADPTLIYNPSTPFLNGGSLQNVVRQLQRSASIYSTDDLLSVLKEAKAAKDTSSGPGLSVTTAALDFTLSSPPAAPILDELPVPVLATVTTNPPPVPRPRNWGTLRAAAAHTPDSDHTPNTLLTPATSAHNGPPFFSSATPEHVETRLASAVFRPNQPDLTKFAPTTVQVGLIASVPREALSGTGITAIEIGTTFPAQPLGQGSIFSGITRGTVVNLMDRGSDFRPCPPILLDLKSVASFLEDSTYYVLSLKGSSLTVRSSKATKTLIMGSGAPAGDSRTYVGALVFDGSMTTATLYPIVQLPVAAPAAGVYGIMQGEKYAARLTFGVENCLLDIVDSNQIMVASGISVKTPSPTDGSIPRMGELYFGSFIGGASTMTLWSVPVFLQIGPSQLPSTTSFFGSMVLNASASGNTGYKLEITDSSLFIYSNINLETGTIGSVSPKKIFLANAVINSAPDDTTSAAFAPCKLLTGVIQQVQLGSFLKYVFIPEDDSIRIGKLWYMVSVINLGDIGFDPNTRPYPPVQWPRSRYWQFANRHNPYLDVPYTGETEASRIKRSQVQAASIGVATAQAKEPMQMYLDANPSQMKVWPIYSFPFSSSSQTVDLGRLQIIIDTVTGLLSSVVPTKAEFKPGPLDDEQITIPDQLDLYNPYTANAATTSTASSNVLNSSMTSVATAPPIVGKPIINLNAVRVPQTTFSTAQAQSSFEEKQIQVAATNLAFEKTMLPKVLGSQLQESLVNESIAAPAFRRVFQPVYGYSVYNPLTGEAFIIELVNADQNVPDQLPRPHTNVTYDPFYVRVVFLSNLTCYNMSIIVPSLVHDRHGNFARLASKYNNVLSKTNELSLGYLYSLYDSSNNFDTLYFTQYLSDSSATPPNLPTSQTCIFTNLPYSTQQKAIFNPLNLFGDLFTPLLVANTTARHSSRGVHNEDFLPLFDLDLSRLDWFFPLLAPVYFVCRRQNWRTDCHLMQATHQLGSSVYVAYGAGDIVPFKLDPAFTVTLDKRQPSHMYKFTKTLTDQRYDSVKNFSVANKAYIVGVATTGGVPRFVNFSIDSSSNLAELQLSNNVPLQFPTEVYVIGQATTTLTSVSAINASQNISILDTGNLISLDDKGNPVSPSYQIVPYNNLVYLIRAVTNVKALSVVGNIGVISGFLVDTFVPSTTGNLNLAQGARHKRSGLSYFGASYTPTTMVDSLDSLDFTSITGETFYTPTIFIPVPELDASKGFVADLSNFLGQQIWTLVYPEIVATPGSTVNGIQYLNGLNIDNDGKPILSLQKLHFVYDTLVTMFTPNDLAHRYPLQPKQKIMALTNGQIQEGICWRSANVQPQRLPPTNICAQQILPEGDGMDRPNIIFSSDNRPVTTSTTSNYMGMSVNSILSMSGVVYSIEESAMTKQTADPSGTKTKLVSAVSSASNLLIGVLFDYDNNDLGTLPSPDSTVTTKGIVFLNGYLGAAGYSFSSPDHFDVNDVLPSQLPRLEQIANAMGGDWDVAFYNTDLSLPRQYWSMAYDASTPPALPNYITNVPPSPIDPTFSNRTRSLILSLQNDVRPDSIGLIDTYSSVVSASLHLQNGVTGSIFLSKKADRDIASIGNPSSSGTLYGLPPGYDFFIFSRDHYGTLTNGQFDLIDNGYAMCLVDDGSGTGNKVAKYYIDSDGNYFELFTYVLSTPTAGIIESSNFILKVSLATPPSGTTPAQPNSINPQDLARRITRESKLVYAAFGASTPGLPPAYLPIQSVGGAVTAAPLTSAPGFNGYTLNVMTTRLQPVQISQIFSGATAYNIAGSTTVRPYDTTLGQVAPFYGSLSHGLDPQTPISFLQSTDRTSYIPRDNSPSTANYVCGGAGLGSLIPVSTKFSWAFQGSAPVASSTSSNTVVSGDDSIIYSYNAVSNTIVDSFYGRLITPTGGQYFIDGTENAASPVYGVITLPTFDFNGNVYTLNLGTTAAGSSSPRYTLITGGKSFMFDPDNIHVTVDGTKFTFNPIKGGAYSVSYEPVEAPGGTEDPSPIPLTPFTIAAGGVVKYIDVFNSPDDLKNILLGPIGRTYTYNPVSATVGITFSGTTTITPVLQGLTFTSLTGFGYMISFGSPAYLVNGTPMYPYSAFISGKPATYTLMTVPKMFTIGGNFYTINQDRNGAYKSVTGNGNTYLINLYQFSLNGLIYIINTNVQPYTVVGGGTTHEMTSGNSQFLLDDVQYTIALRQNSLNGATVSGQYNITQGNVIVIENYAYQLDTLNGRIVGNGTAYPLTTSGLTYTITTADHNFTVTTKPNATTVLISNIVYQINNTTVVGDGVTYPILKYRTFLDGTTKFTIELDGTVSIAPPLSISGVFPFTGATFTDGTTTYTINNAAVYDGATNFLVTTSSNGTQFTVSPTLSYTMRSDAAAIYAGSDNTYLVNRTQPVNANQISFGTQTLFFGRDSDYAAFDGENYFAIKDNEFTDSDGLTWTLMGNTAINQGDSYEIFSNLGQIGSYYFEVPNGATYYVKIPVADTGSATGDIYNVFPITGGQFTMPIKYTVAITGSAVTVSSITVGTAVAEASLQASGGVLTGGSFTDPVTGITYTCVSAGGHIKFVDSNNVEYSYPASGTTNVFIASLNITTGVSVAYSNQAASPLYPITNSQFTVGTTTYTVNKTVAYQNAATGPLWPITNGRFRIPRTDPLSDITYTIKNNGTVTKGFVLGNDDQFSPDGNVVYTVNAVEVVRSSNQSTLTGTSPKTLVSGAFSYTLASATASLPLPGVTYDTTTKKFAVSYKGVVVTYKVGTLTAVDDRVPKNGFTVKTVAGTTQVSFLDYVSNVVFMFDKSGNNQITAQFAYSNGVFIDVVNGIQYNVDEADAKVETTSYIPESTQYAFVPADGNKYLIHYNQVGVVFPVISGSSINAGTAVVGSDTFTVNIDQVVPTDGSAGILIDTNSFEINGNLYTITGTPVAGDYSSCFVAGDDNVTPKPFISKNTFKLTDQSVTYTLVLDVNNLPISILATFAVRPSANLLTINDSVYLLKYDTVTTGSVLGQGHAAIPISESSFVLPNFFDSTTAKFIFADENIHDAASVVGQFRIYTSPTFFMENTTYTYNTNSQIVVDGDKRPYPLITNPAMFSINGFNYLIDTNQVPHCIIGNDNVSPLSTDVTVVKGNPVFNTTFTLNGLIYRYVEDAQHNIVTVTGTRSYPVAQPTLTFRLDSSLQFTIHKGAPPAGNYPGNVVPIGTVSATGGNLVINLYAGIPQTGSLDFFTYKGILYTLTVSKGTYVAIHKAYSVYASQPEASQQQLAVFNMNGTTYMVTTGTTSGDASPAGTNPGTIWAATSRTRLETQFGLVYGFTAQPITVTKSVTGLFQFQVTNADKKATLYDIQYTPGSSANQIHVDTPTSLPGFVQAFNFGGSFTPYPLIFETGGYNAFTTFVEETATPQESFAAAYKTPVTSTDAYVNSLMPTQGDFSLEFWHSIPANSTGFYHPFTYSAQTTDPLVYYTDIAFEVESNPAISNTFVQVNNVIMQAVNTPPDFSSRWRHLALTYSQPYAIACQGAGYEVKQAKNLNFAREFSIGMTFSVTDTQTQQILLYKGTGSQHSPPELSMSYTLQVQGGVVWFIVTDANLKNWTFKGPGINASTPYELFVTKRTVTTAGTTAATDPTQLPFGLGDVDRTANDGLKFDMSSSGSATTIKNIKPSVDTGLTKFVSGLSSNTSQKSFMVTFAVRQILNDGTSLGWNVLDPIKQDVPDDGGLLVNSTGPSHLLIGSGYDALGVERPVGSTSGSTGNIRKVYLFNSAVSHEGIKSNGSTIPITDASVNDLIKSGIVGYWSVVYDPNGVVTSPLDPSSVAIPTNPERAMLLALRGHEAEGVRLFLNGYQMSLKTLDYIPNTMRSYSPGWTVLLFNAGLYRLAEISMWQMQRQPYQILDDMFGRLVISNEPFLLLYLSGSFYVQNPPPNYAPILPMATYIDNIDVVDPVQGAKLPFSKASLDLYGCPAVGRCGPLITPNLYTPPGNALTVCDAPPDLVSYSITINTTTGTPAGIINEAYVYVKDKALFLYAGKKIGDLVLSWVSQEQGDVQLIGYIEGAPPCPQANLTNRPTYNGATSVSLNIPTTAQLKYDSADDHSWDNKISIGGTFGFKFKTDAHISPFGLGIKIPALNWELGLGGGDDIMWGGVNSHAATAANKLEEVGIL